MAVSWASSPPELLRAHHAQDALAQAGEMPADVSETPLPEDGAFKGGLLFTPGKPAGRGVVVYLHGGGFVAGSPATHRVATAWLAQASGHRVLSARYRLAPEHPYPAQRDDAVAAIRQGAAMAGAAGIVLAGDSAGACVALWGYNGLGTDARAAIRGLLLFYGGFGLIDGASIKRYGTAENGLDTTTLAAMYARLHGPSVPPLPWPHEFGGRIAAPVFVLAAGLDAVLDDSLRFARSLAPHPQHRMMVVAGQDHGFLKRSGKDEAVARVIGDAASWVRAVFAA